MMRPLTLGDKLLLTLASLLVFEAGIRGCFDWVRDNEASQNEVVAAGKNHVRNLALTAREAFLKRDRAALEHYADLLRAPDDTDLIYVAFYASTGELLASRSWGEPPVSIFPQLRAAATPGVHMLNRGGVTDARHCAFAFPIETGPTAAPVGGQVPPSGPSGTVVAVRSLDAARAKAVDEQSTSALLTLAILALCLNVLLVFSRRLLEPIQSFVKATERIAAGDFSQPIDVGRRRDELHALADSFNHMAEKLTLQREQILEQNRQLECKVDERTVELVEANRRIRQTQADLVQAEKMRMLGQLAAGVAHEINTPTGAILNVAADSRANLEALVTAAATIPNLPAETRTWFGALVPQILSQGLQASDAATRTRRRDLEKTLRDRGIPEYRRLAALIVKCGLDEPSLDDRVLRHLSYRPVLDLLELLEAMGSAAGITRTSAEKIARIVRALRLYTRVDQAEAIEADLNETIDNTLAILQNRIKQVAEVHTSYGKDLPRARCGPEIAQVWTNLLNNACDAIEEAALGRLGRIGITTSLQDGRLRVTLFNTGKPIPDAVRDRIFDPFFTTKPAAKGTGLGLSICSGIIRDCGGTVRTWNEPDGVVFEVTLAVAEPRPADAPPADEVGACAARNTHGDRAS